MDFNIGTRRNQEDILKKIGEINEKLDNSTDDASIYILAQTLLLETSQITKTWAWNNDKIGLVFKCLTNSKLEIWTTLSSMTAVINSEVAMTAVANSEVAMTAVANSEVAMPAVANSEVAMTAVANSEVAMTAVTNSEVAMTAVINSEVAMPAVANSEVAIMTLFDTAKSTIDTSVLAGKFLIIAMKENTIYSAYNIKFIDGTSITSNTSIKLTLPNGWYNFVNQFPKIVTQFQQRSSGSSYQIKYIEIK